MGYGIYKVSHNVWRYVLGVTLPFGHFSASSTEMSRPTFKHVGECVWLQSPTNANPIQHLRTHGEQILCHGWIR
eukprot:m.88271 g.88271  ORF g.88271 m.88271 type:complete len:74 (-) comp26174_c0_seq1:1559-1780(-)